MPAHKETKHSPYNVEQLLALVADIESYPEFLPWCSAARIIEKNETEEGTVMLAELVVRFKNFRDSYVSEVRISKNDGDALVLVEQKSGPFSELKSSKRLAHHQRPLPVEHPPQTPPTSTPQPRRRGCPLSEGR